MYEKYYKKGRSGYIIELLVYNSDGETKAIIESEDDGTPRLFKNKAEANRHVTLLFKGWYTYDIRGYSIRRATLAVAKPTKDEKPE